MALASSMPCIDRLACQLSLHGLDENCTRKPDFYFSWSEPLDLDFAGRHRSNQKRSRSLPSASVAKRKETAQLNLTYEHSASPKRTRDSSTISTEGTKASIKEGTEIHSAVRYTSPGHLTLSVNKYANEANRHKGSDADSVESSDDEVSGLLLHSLNWINDSPRILAEITALQKSRQNLKCNIGESSIRKRSLNENESSKDTKRHRPRLDFDKMQLSKNEVVQVAQSEQSFLDDVYFRPIIAFNLED